MLQVPLALHVCKRSSMSSGLLQPSWPQTSTHLFAMTTAKLWLVIPLRLNTIGWPGYSTETAFHVDIAQIPCAQAESKPGERREL